MKLLSTLDKYFEETLAVMLFAAILALGAEQVFSRYILRGVHSWTEEMMRILFVALALVSFVLCEKRRQHVRVEILDLILPPSCRKILAFFTAAVFLLFSLLVAKYAFDITLLQYNTHQTTAAMGFPTWVYFSLGPVFFVILALRIVQFEILPLFRKGATEGTEAGR